MSLVPSKTHFSPTEPLFAPYTAAGGGGGGQNLTVSTIVIEGSTQPLSIDLPAAANDGFEVRQGGGTNALAILTIDAENSGQAEFGVRSLSTIGGNPVPRGRFEQQVQTANDLAQLTYTLDTVGAGAASTIGSIQFKPGDLAGSYGGLILGAESGAGWTIGAGNGYNTVANGPSGADTALLPRRITFSGTNVYLPAAGAASTIASFSTLTNHAYELYIPKVRIQNEPAGVPTAGAWADMSIDTSPNVSYLDTFDMASVSTINNDLQMARSYSFVASGTGHNLVLNNSLSGALSTSYTFVDGYAILRDLGLVSAIAPAVAAP